MPLIETLRKLVRSNNNHTKQIADGISSNAKYKTINTNKGKVGNIVFDIDSIGKIKTFTNITINFPNKAKIEYPITIDNNFNHGLKSYDENNNSFCESQWPLKKEFKIEVDQSLEIGDDVIIKKQQIVLNKVEQEVYDQSRDTQFNKKMREVNKNRFAEVRQWSIFNSFAPYYKIVIEKDH